MKMNFRKVKNVLAVFLLVFVTQASFALEKSIGFDLGEKIHWSEGDPYNSHSFSLTGDFSGETFGIKPFFCFSFSVTNASYVSSNTVQYNYKDTNLSETFGVKPYFIFRRNEISRSYIGFLFAVSFYQQEREVSPRTIKNVQHEINYMAGELGLFAGNKWSISNNLNVYAECDISSRLFSSYSSYKIDGKELDDYQSNMFGGGGGSSWRLYVTPRVGVAYIF